MASQQRVLDRLQDISRPSNATSFLIRDQAWSAGGNNGGNIGGNGGSGLIIVEEYY